MVDLDLVQNLLKNATPSNSSEYPPDEHFDQIVDYVEKEKINEAAEMIEKIFAKGIPDIRLIIYYLYAHFTNHGIKSFVETFPVMISLVTVHWEVLAPSNRKDKHVQSSLNWFFSQILLKLKYSEKLHNTGKINPVWKKSVLDVSPEELNNLISIAHEFKNFFLDKWPKSPTKDRVLHLVKKIEEFQPFIVDISKPIESNEGQEEEEQEGRSQIEPIVATLEETSEERPYQEESYGEETYQEYHDQVELSQEASVEKETFEKQIAELEPFEQITSEQAASIPDDKGIQQNSMEIGEKGAIPKQTELPTEMAHVNEETLFLKRFDDFSRKLKIFESLIIKNDYLKAAVVAKDIDHLIETFDPLNYFPKLFAKYFSLFAKHVAALSAQYQNSESLQIKTLEKLYRTDLDMFVEW